MSDNTEQIRKFLVHMINGQVESQDEQAERARLETEYGQVWNTSEVQQDFEIIGFLAPFCEVKRKSDGAKGALTFQHMPRFYFNFQPFQ